MSQAPRVCWWDEKLQYLSSSWTQVNLLDIRDVGCTVKMMRCGGIMITCEWARDDEEASKRWRWYWKAIMMMICTASNERELTNILMCGSTFSPSLRMGWWFTRLLPLSLASWIDGDDWGVCDKKCLLSFTSCTHYHIMRKYSNWSEPKRWRNLLIILLLEH